MIHFEDAHSAHPAMVAPVGLVLGTPFAMAPLSRTLRLLKAKPERISASGASFLRDVLPLCMTNHFLVWYGPRVCQNAPCIANEQHQGSCIEGNNLHQGIMEGVFMPEKWHTMVKHVDEPKSYNLGHDEQNW